MSDIVPPLGSSSRSWLADNVGAVGQHMTSYVGRLHSPEGRTPVVYFHGFFGDGIVTLAGTYQTAFTAITATSLPLLVPELGGGSVWATPALVDAGGYADDALAWAATSPIVTGTSWTNATVTGMGVRADKVAVHGWSMGSLNGLNWAWRNAGKVRAVVLVGPIVDAEKFYDDNATFQGAIDASWGSHAAFEAALPDIDPMRNLDLIRPFGHRIQLWYAEDDEFIDPDDVRAFAELVGAEAHGFPGTHADLLTVPADQAAIFTLDKVRDRARAYVGWNDSDLGRFETVPVTLPSSPGNVNEFATTVAVGGRRGEWIRASGTEGNERHALLLNDVSAPDMAVRTIWHDGGGGSMVGQSGNFLRAVVDGTDFLAYTVWANVLFSVPWIVNRGVWGAVVGGNSLSLLGTTNSVIPGIRLAAGGEVLASERQGDVVTLVVHEADADRAYRSGVIDVVLPGIANYSGIVTRVDANHLSYEQEGADVTSGGPGSWADFASCFPYVADTELYGTVLRGRFYVPGTDAPEWGDPDWTFEWEDTGGWGATGYGRGGVMPGHVGIWNPSAYRPRIQFGPLTVEEL